MVYISKECIDIMKDEIIEGIESLRNESNDELWEKYNGKNARLQTRIVALNEAINIVFAFKENKETS